MKKLCILLLLLIPASAFAQSPYVQSVTLNQNTASGPSVGWNMSGRGVTSYMFTWVTLGTVSAGACALVSSTENTFASPSTVIAAQTVTSSGSYTTPTAANANFVRFACSTPISGSGTVTLTMFGLQPADAVASGGATSANQVLELAELTDISTFTERTAIAAESTTPVAVACITRAFGANPTAGTANTDMQPICNRQGTLLALTGGPNPFTIRASLTGAATDTALVTVTAGLKIGVTRASLACSAATSVSVSLLLGFGAANTPTTTGVVLAEPGTAASTLSGITTGNGGGLLGIGADGEDLRYTSSAATSGSCDLVVSGFTIES